MSEHKSENITWHNSEVTSAMRREARGHKGAVLWFTGLSGAGKSTLAARVEKRLFDRGVVTMILDGDNVRHGLCSDLGFSPEDRQENIRRVGEVAKLFADSGAMVLTAFISPYRADRDRVREIVGDHFVEVHVFADVATCEARDPKGLYKRARAGEIKGFTGIDAPYEAPNTPELKVDTSNSSIDESANLVLTWLEARGAIPNA